MSRSETTLRVLLDLHDRLVAEFAGHQEALLDREVPRARAAFARFEEALRAHIRHEDEVLLPVYRARCAAGPGAGVELFTAEHRKIEAFLDEIRARLGAIEREGAAPAAVIALLDRQATFKGLLAHHDLRERNALYPALDEATTPEERARLLAAAD